MTEWVLVPREPTAKMVLAAFDAITNASGEGMIRARWRCMLDAAPAAPQQAEPCDVCNALTVPRNATHYDADDLKAAQVRGKIIAAKLQQQAEPAAQIGWADEFGNLFPMGAWKPAQRTHHDSHKTAWRPVFLHPPADEVRRLRDAVAKLSTIVRVPNAEHIADEHNAAVAFLRRALEGGA